MKINYIIGISLISLIFADPEPQTGWDFDQTTQQSFYLFQDITIDGDVVVGDGSGVNEGDCYTSGNCDVVGAFIDRDGVEVCVGWVYADATVNVTTVPIMGFDPANEATADYLNPGEVAYLKVYDDIRKLFSEQTLVSQ